MKLSVAAILSLGLLQGSMAATFTKTIGVNNFSCTTENRPFRNCLNSVASICKSQTATPADCSSFIKQLFDSFPVGNQWRDLGDKCVFGRTATSSRKSSACVNHIEYLVNNNAYVDSDVKVTKRFIDLFFDVAGIRR